MTQKPTTIFINPKFKNAHFNPHFLPNKKIHVNPKFLHQSVIPEVALQPVSVLPTPTNEFRSNAIIRNTRRTLIRTPAFPRSNVSVEVTKTAPSQQLIRLSKNKLVTAAHLMKCQQKENEIITKTKESIIKSKKLQRKTETKDSVYKIDRRYSPIKKKKKIVSTYSIRRVDANKATATNSSSKNRSSSEMASSSKSLIMIDINGVLYNSTRKKLEKTSSAERSDKMLVIRGQNFLLDPSGSKLRRDSENSSLKLSRIHIGGLTYRASQNGAYERDNSYQIRNHLSLARTKSISLLARNSIHKPNDICPIYRRLGKCLSYANGRCHKLHDQRYVIVCSKFIKGSCGDEKCLLSHNANLHKMPVCKYFLRGLCQKQRECLYLHKKLTDDTKLCTEFLRGYCPLADKCKQLHDFPWANKKFSVVRKKPNLKLEEAEKADNSRYYIEEESSNNDNRNIPQRKALGSLPSYIPL